MSWWTYVERIAETERQRDISDRTGIDATNVTRWKTGQVPKPAFVATFARAYGRPVLEAFVAAGFLTEAEAKVRPSAAPNFTQLTNDELLELVRARMREEGDGHGDRAPATKAPDSGPVLKAVASGGSTPAEAEEASERAAKSKARQQADIDEMERRLAEKGKEES